MVDNSIKFNLTYIVQESYSYYSILVQCIKLIIISILTNSKI